MEGEHAQMWQIPCKMTNSSSKPLQTLGKWYQPRNPKKNPKPAQKKILKLFHTLLRMMEYELARTQTVATVAWGPHSTQMFAHFLVDRRTALMVGWTEKAGCTGAVTSLLRHMHLLGHAMKYSSWLSPRQIPYRIWKCQPMTRIKFVRNPYQRVISSYVACLSEGFLKDVLSLYQTRMAFTAQQFNVTDITFEQFLDALSWLLDNNLYDRVQEHAGFQVTPFEAGFAATGEPLFDCIYQIEHDNSEVVDQLFQTSFAFNTLAPHATKRQSQNQTLIAAWPN